MTIAVAITAMSPMRMTMLLLLLLLAFMLAPAAQAGAAAAIEPSSMLGDQLAAAMGHIQLGCLAKCEDQNRTGPAGHIECGHPCYVMQCTLGCQNWERALDSSCKSVCNATDDAAQPHTVLGAQAMYCTMSCNGALAAYFAWLLTAVGTPSAPVLVADTLTATSLSLEWEMPARLAAFTGGRPLITKSYLVQWRYEEMANDWKFCRNQSITGDNSTVRVDNLHPYTKYRFRVALILSKQPEEQQELFSEQSVIISTRAAGRPSSEPASVRATAVDHARISVSWEPGAFPNGKLLSYELRIAERKAGGVKGYEAIQDLPASDLFHMIGGLHSNTTYILTIRMVNEVGQGPAGITLVTTPPAPATNVTVPVTFILAGHSSVCSKGLKIVSDPLNTLYTSDRNITSIAVHVRHNLLFVADESATVIRTALDGWSPHKIRHIIRQGNDQTNGITVLLSIDWLNDHLYMLIERSTAGQRAWHIARCDLDGLNETPVLSGLLHRPAHFEVDPYNGYLFWSMADCPEAGLYRLVLNSGLATRTTEEVPFRMLPGNDPLGPFTIDYNEFRLLVPQLNDGRIISVNLAGRETMVVRNSTTTRRTLRTVATVHGTFYWSADQRLWYEEFHSGQRIYYQNNFSGQFFQSLLAIRLNGTAAQPQPAPKIAPERVQAVLAQRRARVEWQRPRLVPMQSAGAWQRWQYALEVLTDEGLASMAVQLTVNITETSFVISDLLPDTDYRFRVMAYTAAGNGPWSVPFRARTLRESPAENATTLIWSTTGRGLLQTDVLGESVDVLLPATNSYAAGNISGMAWHRDLLFIVSDGRVAALNRTTRIVEAVAGLRTSHVQSIAVDWLAERLYWLGSDRLVYRGSFDGTDPELVVSAPGEIHMVVDSPGGFLYYAYAQSVASCRLNGRQWGEHYRAVAYDMSAGKQVMGLTLDMDRRRVYWIGRGFGAASLFSAPMRADGDIASGVALHALVTETPMLEETFCGPLTYFNDRFVWLQDANVTVVANMSGGSAALMRDEERLVGLRSVLAIDGSQHPVPEVGDGDAEVNVRPEAVAGSSIRVQGTWDAVNVSWAAVQRVNYGQVFYEVRFMNQTWTDVRDTFQVHASSVLPPYSLFEVSVQAFTYWTKGPAVRAQLRTPPARPGRPQHVRVFVQRPAHSFTSGRNVARMSARIRWSEPAATNGPLTGYALQVWCVHASAERVQVLQDKLLAASQLEHILHDLEANAVYYVQVQAVSAAGRSDPTDVHPFNASNEQQLPELRASRPNYIVSVDIDLNTTAVYAQTGSAQPVRLLQHIAAERRMFWVNENNEIVTFDGQAGLKLAACSSAVLAMCVDWVNRVLYWSQALDQKSVIGASASAVYALDFSAGYGRGKPRFLGMRQAAVRSMVVDPARETLLWLEHSPAERVSRIYKHTLPLNQTAVFIVVDKVPEPHELLLDWRRNSADPQLIFAGSDGRLHASPLGTPHAQLLPVQTTGAPHSNLVADGERLYWLADGVVHSTDGLRMPLPGAVELFAAAPQPYPPLECLVPLLPVSGYVPTLLNATDSSLLLQLPAAERPPACSQHISGTVYTVSYGPLRPGEEDGRQVRSCTPTTCRTLTVYEPQALLDHLTAFTAYKAQVSLTNYYAKRVGQPSTPFAAPVVFSTAIGTPSQPRDLTVVVLSPHEVRVQWRRAVRPNAPQRVRYQVLWRTQMTQISAVARQDYERKDDGASASSEDAVMSVVITGLLADQPYSVSVRAFTSNATYNQTADIEVRTLPEPLAIRLLNATAYTLRVHWPRYANATRVVLCCEPLLAPNGTRTVFDSADDDDNSTSDEFLINDLQPMTRYRLTTWLYFGPQYSVEPYRWPTVVPSPTAATSTAVASASSNGNDARFVFTTLGDVPSAPGRPKIELVRNAVYKITWEPPRENGSPILQYRLEAWQRSTAVEATTAQPASTTATSTASTIEEPTVSRVRRLAHDEDDFQQQPTATTSVAAASSVDPLQSDNGVVYTRNVATQPRSVEQEHPAFLADGWQTVYNGTESYWIVDERALPDIRTTFRVFARNALGWSRQSLESVPVGEHVMAGDRKYLVVAIGVPVSVMVFVVLAACGIVAFRCRIAEKKPFADGSLHGATTLGSLTHNGGVGHHHHHHQHHNGSGGGNGTLLRLPDVELATLRELSRNGHHLLQHNQLYAQGSPLTDADIALLPQIRRCNIVMRTFLGSGQFGDVYEGVLTAEGAKQQRVAIKTLKKGASKHDKDEFLKEAQLMNNFKHEHIMRLIGVCFHADELYIIMELMQGGDLRSFLQQSRPTAHKPTTLTQLDLIAMCVDIAAGCRYLEEMHFVHRDLACRNCLVSSADRSQRVVKIGDFGLARDIYKNDYYRNDGRGPLPVCWMSPESLADYVFTSQSDIWSFGVLCWEVMTLGERPYPGRSNEEVIQYVRDGGRLTQPPDCPDELYALMLRCWCHRPDERPTFRYCLVVLQQLQMRLVQAEREANDEGGMMMSMGGRVQNGAVSNRSYLLSDENHNLKKTGLLHISTVGHDLIEPPIIVTPTSSKGSPSPVAKYLDMIYVPEPDDDDDIDHRHNLHHHEMVASGAVNDNGYEIPRRDIEEDDDNNDDVEHIDDSSLSAVASAAASDACSDNLSQTSSCIIAQQLRHGASLRHGATPTSDGVATLTQSQRRRDLRQRPADKERTFSSSSTVSEHTVFPTGGGGGCAQQRLHVVLPLEECGSKETLLSQQQQQLQQSQQQQLTGTGTTAEERRSQRRSLRKQSSLKRAAAGARIALGCAEAKTIM